MSILLICLFGGGLAGFVFGLAVIAVVQNVIVSLALYPIVLVFFIWGIWKHLMIGRWLVVIRKLIEVYLVSCFLTIMYTFEESDLGFSAFEWNITFLFMAGAISFFSAYFIITQYFSESRIHREIEHLLRGMQIFGLLPGNDEEE